MKQACRLAVIAGALGAGCGAIGASSEPEPVGIVLEGSGDVPALEIALVARPSGAAEKMIEPLTGALHAALSSCGKQGFDSLAGGLSLAFEQQAGRMRAKHEPTDALGRCVASALPAKLPQTSPAESFDLLLRAPHSGARAEGSAPRAH
jgi:hypothetical protein